MGRYRDLPNPTPQFLNKSLIEITIRLFIPKQTFKIGQNVWESIGGMEVGSIWGHGSYVAPDWTADWIHREAEFLLDLWAQRDFKTSFEALNVEQQGGLKARLVKEIKTNTYSDTSQTIEILSRSIAGYSL